MFAAAVGATPEDCTWMSASRNHPTTRASGPGRLTEEAVPDAAEEVGEAVVLDVEALLDSAATQAAVELLAETAASTEAWVPLLGVVEKPHAAAVVFSSAP